MQPLVSIITPVFNAEKYIEQTIRSVFAQSYAHWELIIINDGSTDQSKELVHSFSDERVKYLEQVNKGVSAARNLGLSYMQGDYFCFLDADDVLPHNSLKCRLDVFQTNPDIHFVDGTVEYYDNTLRTKLQSWTPNFQGNPLHDLLLLTGKSFFGSTWMIKRQPGVHYSFKEGLTHGEDLLFYINLSRMGGRYSFTTETVLHYRRGHTSAMTNLQGLEAGYWHIYDELMRMDDIATTWKRKYLSKVKSIMVKSYLRNGKLLNAISTLFR